MTKVEERGIAGGTTYRTRLMGLLMAGVGMYAGVLLAAPGDLDPGFGDHGRVQLSFDGGLDGWVAGAGPAIVRQPDGRVLVARTDKVGIGWGDSEVALARLRVDGTLDPEFGNGGVVRLRFREGESAGAGGLALLPDGRIVVVGYSVTAWQEGGMGDYPNLNSGLALIRADGSLDPDGFGNGGRTSLDLSAAGRNDLAVAVVALEDGRIVVAGTAEGDSGTRLFIVRMTLQGSVDRSFGEGNGFTWTPSIEELSGLHRSATGQFVACGTRSASGLGASGQIARFDSAGRLVGETSLGSAGLESVSACALMKDGGVVVGSGGSLARVGVDGQLDMTFGEEWGLTDIFCRSCILWDQLGYARVPTDIAVLTDNRLAVALDGYGWGQLAMLRFTLDGRPDTSSLPSLTDRFYDVGWRDLPPSAGVSRLLSTAEGGLLAVVAGSQGTIVMRLKASGGSGASVIGLQGDVTQQSESDSRGLVVCRSGSSEGMATVNYASRDGTALSPGDYVPVSGRLDWGDGEAGCKVIQITVTVDTQSEPVESIWVELTDAIGAGVAMNKARLYIVDAQSSAPAPLPTPAPPPTAGGNSTGGGGAAGSALLALLAALACLRRVVQPTVAHRRRIWASRRGMIAARTTTALTMAAGTPVPSLRCAKSVAERM